MPVRFRKRFQLGPWLYATASPSGVSWTFRPLWPIPLSYNTRARRWSLDLPGPFSWQSRPKVRPRRRG